MRPADEPTPTRAPISKKQRGSSREAAAYGAELVQLPEKWNAIGDAEALHANAESLQDGESVAAMADWARTHGIWLIGGSITERREGREKLSNTCLVFDPEGEIAAVYRKIHMFDVEVGGIVYRESEAEEPGDEPVVARVGDWTVGLSICYDVRFPELYRVLALEGAELLTRPGALHAPHRARPLGGAAARPGDRELVLRRRGGADRRDPAGQTQLRAVVDRRSVGARRRARARRGRRDLCRPRPERVGGAPKSSLAREAPPEAYRWPATI